MKIKFNTKYNTIAFYTVVVFAICIVLVLLAFRLGTFIAAIRRIMTAISPVIWGFIIAYIMSPIVRKTEEFLEKKVFHKKKHEKIRRSLSIVTASLIGIALIVGLIAMAVPQIIDSISTLFNNMPDYLNSLYDSIIGFLKKNPEISHQVTEWIEQQFENIEDIILGWITDLRPTFEKYIILLKDGLLNFLVGVKDFFLGYIVSVYLLFSKEHFILQFKKLCYALLPKRVYDVLMVKGTHANKIFSDFLVGKALDSFLIGMFCFIILVIFQIPNAMLISFIIGVTNMIPFFGPFIGAIPSALLVLLTSPGKTILFVIIILVLQQFDGNILGPKILGNKLNLPTFWIMFSIFFFGNLFGFIGMLAGVPIFAVIYTLTKEFVDERIRVKNYELLKKGLDSDIEEINEVPEEPF
ncbi:MAG: AI-2E family transporter [Oscillospiraceae bacterium]|nr:AI-2E family transporter [Oscillospiraceae bacterium]